MRRALFLTYASLVASAAGGAYSQPMESELFVAEFRLVGGPSLEALAWRSGDDILVMPETLRALGMEVGAFASDAPVSLGAIAGASFSFLRQDQAIVITCSALCFPAQTLRPSPPEQAPLTNGRGGFLSAELIASRIGESEFAAGAFDLGLFSNGGFGGVNWIVRAEDDISFVRLDTSWTIDFPARRLRLRLGDAIAPASGAAGIPIRFGGVQWGTEFSLDPTFIRFPAPTLRGDAATPSVVELYVDGALRARENVAAGPFEIVDPPVVAGAGLAQIVVTDALGRQQQISAPFYASPDLLRPGLSEFTLAAGAERERYALESAAYGRFFVLAAYRRGLTAQLTGETRLELGEDLANASAAVSFAANALGQADLAFSLSHDSDGAGTLAHFAWSRRGEQLSFAADVEAASTGYRRLGQRIAPSELSARATAALDLGDHGAIALTAAGAERRETASISTLGLSYTPRARQFGALSLNALYVDDGQPFISFGFTFMRALGGHRTSSIALETSDGEASAMARIQQTARRDGGLGWRIGVSGGAIERLDLALQLRGPHYDASLEAARTPGEDGLRGQFASAIIWMEDAFAVSRPVRDSFALIDLGIAGVDIYRDRQRIGRTGADGRLLVSDLRPYERNRISIDVEDLPFEAAIETDHIDVRPPPRSGALVRFPVTAGLSGEIEVVDANGDALRAGTILVRDTDQSRFPVARGGRLFLSGVNGGATLTDASRSCQIVVTPAALAQDAPLQCSTPESP
jgi:outer membrane usher protein